MSTIRDAAERIARFHQESLKNNLSQLSPPDLGGSENFVKTERIISAIPNEVRVKINFESDEVKK